MDLLSPELREVEREIDSVYESNPLTKQSFAVAMWYLMAVIEDYVFLPILSDENITRFKLESLIDRVMFIVKQPTYWLRSSCTTGGQVPTRFDANHYEAAQSLLKLAFDYDTFRMIFTHASRGLLRLELQGNSLISTDPIPVQSQYEAYNRLIKPVNIGFVEEKLFAGLDQIYEKLRPDLTIDGERFSFNINPKLVNFTVETIRPILEQKFTLPEHWSFSHYDLASFKKIVFAISALAYLQFAARFLAAQWGCKWSGVLSSILIARPGELLARLGRYTGLSREVIKSIVHDLTFGSNNIPASQADPAQQPLIRLNEDQYAISPHLWINNATERNFVSLLNKVPTERQRYLSLVNTKEEIMRERLKAGIKNPRWLTWSGSIRGTSQLPDIDLAIISHEEKACLLLELKWFIDPAEAREVLEKSEEISKGVSQLLRIKDAIAEGNQNLIDSLGIDQTYVFSFVVVSANWIGHESEQNPDIAIVREHHLVKKMEMSGSLLEIIAWLSNRQYLPVDGVHYKVFRISSTVGKWETKWYGLKPLLEEEEFLPL